MAFEILIIEDEQLAANKLKRYLSQIEPQISKIDCCGSVSESLEILSTNEYDLIYSDIQLSDGLSFEIFNQIDIDTPIIFTTAYDQYAMDAFKTNGIDYLLKPIKKATLEKSLEKYSKLKKVNRREIDYSSLIDQLQSGNSVIAKRERFLVQSGTEELKSISINEIAYFFADGKYTFLVCKNGKEYFADQTISTLAEELDKKQFFQLNRKFIVSIESIQNIIRYTKSRLKIELDPPSNSEAIVSSERASAFKKWLGK